MALSKPLARKESRQIRPLASTGRNDVATTTRHRHRDEIGNATVTVAFYRRCLFVTGRMGAEGSAIARLSTART
jgi:hypothetical protein